MKRVNNIIKGGADDVIQSHFYKNPVLIIFVLYIIIIYGTYSSMDDYVKDSYVYNNKFRDSDGEIHWLDIITYPYDYSSYVCEHCSHTGLGWLWRVLAGPRKVASIILSSPIMVYLLVGIYLTVKTIDSHQKRNQAYFYSVMFSFLVILVMFVIHVFIFHFIIDTKDINIELRLGDPDNVKKTYEAFYRTQWLLLVVFSPIIISGVVYVTRKLGNGGSAE